MTETDTKCRHFVCVWQSPQARKAMEFRSFLTSEFVDMENLEATCPFCDTRCHVEKG